MNLTDIIETLSKSLAFSTKAEVQAAFDEQKAIANDYSYGMNERILAKRLAKFLNQELKSF
jgi:hypothetical protein